MTIYHLIYISKKKIQSQTISRNVKKHLLITTHTHRYNTVWNAHQRNLTVMVIARWWAPYSQRESQRNLNRC